MFYLGHMEAFDWNLIARHALDVHAFHPTFDRLFAFGIDAGLLLERHAFQALFATEDTAEGMRSFQERGPGKAEFTGS